MSLVTPSSSPTRTRPRVTVGLGFVQAVRPALYALLLASALLTFFAGTGVAGHPLPVWATSAAPWLFAVFLVVFAIYRLTLVRARRYPAAIGLFQIGLGALVWVLLLPGVRRSISPPVRAQDSVQSLLGSEDPRVRSLAAEVAGTRSDGTRYAEALIDRLTDAEPEVRRAAHGSLVRLFGIDAGDDAAAWRGLIAGRGNRP